MTHSKQDKKSTTQTTTPSLTATRPSLSDVTGTFGGHNLAHISINSNTGTSTTGNALTFAPPSPSLPVAHEAAHIMQQPTYSVQQQAEVEE